MRESEKFCMKCGIIHMESETSCSKCGGGLTRGYLHRCKCGEFTDPIKKRCTCGRKAKKGYAKIEHA